MLAAVAQKQLVLAAAVERQPAVAQSAHWAAAALGQPQMALVGAVARPPVVA
jgi:hypothetical protein